MWVHVWGPVAKLRCHISGAIHLVLLYLFPETVSDYCLSGRLGQQASELWGVRCLCPGSPVVTGVWHCAWLFLPWGLEIKVTLALAQRALYLQSYHYSLCSCLPDTLSEKTL